MQTLNNTGIYPAYPKDDKDKPLNPMLGDFSYFFGIYTVFPRGDLEGLLEAKELKLQIDRKKAI